MPGYHLKHSTPNAPTTPSPTTPSFPYRIPPPAQIRSSSLLIRLQTLPNNRLRSSSSGKPILLPTPIFQIPLRLGPHPQDAKNHIIAGICLGFLPLLLLRFPHGAEVARHHDGFRAARARYAEHAGGGVHAAHPCWSGEAVEAGGLFLLAVCGCCGHGFGGADEVVRWLEVEEVEVLEVVIFRAFEHVQRNAEGFAGFVDGVEEVEEGLFNHISICQIS